MKSETYLMRLHKSDRDCMRYYNLIAAGQKLSDEIYYKFDGDCISLMEIVSDIAVRLRRLRAAPSEARPWGGLRSDVQNYIIEIYEPL